MTREEEIQEAAEVYSAYIDSTGEEYSIRYNSIELEAFKDGAEYADKHPNWHNVAENPAKQGVYLVRVEVYGYGMTTPCKFTKYELAPYAEYQGVMKWHTLGFSYPNSRITHWMEIPAVELNIEHTAKNQTATIDAWLARDWTGLYLYESMPKPQKSYGDEYDLGNHIRIGNCKDIFKDVKDIKDGGKTKKVKVTIELEEE